ncbi:unnamed protein product, partial [Rotaria socialis]|uniref:Uncharacterized protein n=1 Tax=Rotaria socialis TaxID=392032 RepID=A0A817TWC1_9BILA
MGTTSHRLTEICDPYFTLPKPNSTGEIGQNLYDIEILMLLTPFQRASDEIPFLRSSRHKNTEFGCVRDGLQKCYASHRIKTFSPSIAIQYFAP